MSWLSWRERVCRLDRLPNSAGMLPVSWLPWSERYCRLGRSPNSAGMLPVSWLFWSWGHVTCPPEQMIPCQPQGVSEVSQPSLLDQNSPFVLLYSETSASHSEIGISETLLQSNSAKAFCCWPKNSEVDRSDTVNRITFCKYFKICTP